MEISDLGPPDDHLLDDDDNNSIHYSRHRHQIRLTIVILFLVCFILFLLTSIFLFIFLKNQRPLVPIKDQLNSNSIRGIKAGQIFGNAAIFTFDDSSMENFTSSYYLRGVIIRLDSDCLEWIQCCYSSDNYLEHMLQNVTHGRRKATDVGEPFFLENDEKISKVQMKVDNVQLYQNGVPSFTPRLIRNIRFFTTKGRSSPQIDQFKGDMFTEEFEDYTLAYLTGSAGRYIHQLQFYWYQTTNS